MITGEGYLETDGYMDSYGGGDVEEWTSIDNGKTWQKKANLTPDAEEYPGWKFNNIQPVTYPDGSVVKGKLLFYGWKHKGNPEARAFLLIEK